ncbi:MAG: alpha/beta fold hydrolase [Pseudomonadota bacterium]
MVVGLLVLGGIAVFQDRLLYFPEGIDLPSLLAQTHREKLQAWPAEGEFRGLVRSPEGTARGTLVMFHGNAGHAGHRAFYAGLARYGLRVILAEYPGYGPRTGKPGETVLVADALETLARVRRDFGGPVLLAGESLGAGVAAATYARAPESVAGLWLITPWDSLANVARHHYPWLPVKSLLRDRYDNLRHLADAKAPVAILVAERDSIIPARFGRYLYEQLHAPKRLWQVPGAEHDDWPGFVDEGWWAEMADHLLQSSGGWGSGASARAESALLREWKTDDGRWAGGVKMPRSGPQPARPLSGVADVILFNTPMKAKTMPRLLRTVSFLVLMVASAAQAGDDARLNSALRLLDVMDMRDTLTRTIEQSLEVELEKSPELRPFRQVMLTFLNKHMGFDSVRMDFAQIYAEAFNEKELAEMASFYATPTGRKAIEKLPELTAMGARLGQRKVEENAAELQAMITDEARRLEALLKK